MSGILAWALLTGAVTGGVWVGIVLIRRFRMISERQPAELEDMRRRLDELEGVDRRLAEVEERLEFAERLLARQQEPGRLPPPGE